MFQRVVQVQAQYHRKFQLFSRNARLMLLTSFLTGLAFGGYHLLFNFYALSLGSQYDEAFLGTLQTAQSFAAILIALPAAYLAGRFRQKYLLVLSSFLGALALLGVVFVPLQIPLLLFRMLIGVSGAMREVFAAPFLMVNTEGEERLWVFSFYLGIATTAEFIGNTLGGFLPSLFANGLGINATSTEAYQWAIACLAILEAASIIPLLFIRSEESRAIARPSLPWHLLQRYGRELIPFFSPQLLIGLGAGLMMPFMNLYFRSVFGASDALIGIVFALGAISMTVAQFVAPPLADKRGKIQTVLFSQGLSIPFLLTMGVAAFAVPSGLGGSLLWFIAAVIAYNARLGLMNMGNPVYQTFMLERVPQEVGALAVSISSISFQFGWFVMPQISGWLQVRFGQFGFVPIFAGVVLLYFLAILLEYHFFKPTLQLRPAVESA